MDVQTKIQICGLIAGILSSDEEVDVHEAGFLRRMRKRFALPKGTPVQLIVDHDEAVTTLQGFAEEVRNEAWDLLIQAAAIDGKIAPAERSFLDVIADKLQVAPEDLDARLEQQMAMSKPQPFGPAASSDDD